MPGENRLLIIAVDEYTGDSRFPPLSNAKLDANRFAKVLTERYGFSMVANPLYDSQATRDNICDALIDLADSNNEDNVVIYFAGHGLQNQTSKKGYWIPFDFVKGQKSFILNSSVLDYIDGVDAKHLLLISDSCYSGTFITRTRGGTHSGTHDELEKLRSRWMFVSGEEKKVSDGVPGIGSPFGISLCEFLEKNVRSSVSASELFDEVIGMVKRRCTQNPAADEIPSEFNEGGQMIFRLKEVLGIPGEDPLPGLIFPLPELKIEHYLPRQLTFQDKQQVRDIWFFRPEIGTIYLNQIIRSQKRIVILGAAGSGKSVEMLYLAHQLQQNQEDFTPIYRRFNTYTDGDIEEYLPDGWRNTDPANLVVLLDGLDEIPSMYFPVAIRKLQSFSENNPHLRVVVSCRNNFYELPHENFSGTLADFVVYSLNDLTIPEIRNYVFRVKGIDPDDFVTKLFEANLLDIVQKPFFMNILIRYFSTHNNFKSGRSSIMEEALFNYFVNDKEHFVATVPRLSRAQTFSYLEKIAFSLEMVGKNTVTEDELSVIFPGVNDFTVSKYLPAFGKSADKETWQFEHNNLQEFLAARVLSKKSLNQIIAIISTDTAGINKVKPSWVNTLSFLVSQEQTITSKQLLEWIIQNDREVVVKFEANRLSAELRINIFKDIFDFYSDRQIWIHSNLFSDRDLARFGESENTLNFLIEKIENLSTTRIARFNALHILRNFHPSEFPSQIDRLKNAVLRILDIGSLSGSDVYSVLGCLADLKILDKDDIKGVLETYDERRNEYVRAGLYKLLISHHAVEDNISVFLRGIDLAELESPASDREGINLMDESYLLKVGLESVQSPNALRSVLSTLINSSNKRELLLLDYHETVICLLNRSRELPANSSDFFELFIKLLLQEALHDRKNIIEPILAFFDHSGTRWKAFKIIWEDKATETFEKGFSLSRLLNINVVRDFLADHTGNTQENDAQIREFHHLIWWHRNNLEEPDNLLSTIEKIAAETNGLHIERPIEVDWATKIRDRNQKSFDLLFNNHEMLTAISTIFEELNLREIGKVDLIEFQRTQRFGEGERFPVSAVLAMNFLTRQGRIISFEDMKNWITADASYLQFRVGHIHSNLFNRNDLLISDEQISFLEEYSAKPGHNHRIVWDFLNRFKLNLPEEVLLSLVDFVSLSYDFNVTEPGSLDILEQFVSQNKLRERVFDHLNNQSLPALEWVNNAAYALRKNFRIVFPQIVQRLKASKEAEFKYLDILELWYTRTADDEKLKDLVSTTINRDIMWKGLNLLNDTEKESEFINKKLRNLLNDETIDGDTKSYAANFLMKLNDEFGLNYLANLIFQGPTPEFDFHLKLGNISGIKRVTAIDTLLKLLTIGRQPEFKTDVFNSLEERVLTALFSIGTVSSTNFVKVKNAISAYIDSHAQEPNINFLYFTIAKMEDQLKINYSSSITLQSAVDLYNNLTNSGS